MSEDQLTTTFDFDAIRLKIASPEAIRQWSYGEVTKPETINYRTQKPEKDGLFDERIFGPTKDWECYCGKYKRIRYKGIVCDKCGVEVTRSLVRRVRMGHIELAAPVSHIWFLRGVPSKIGLVLDMSLNDLEKVIYFASFVVVNVNEELRQQMLEQVKEEYKARKRQLVTEFQKSNKSTASAISKAEVTTAEIASSLPLKARLQELEEAVKQAQQELLGLRPKQVISESVYHNLSLKYGHIFEAKIGAEAIYHLLKSLDLEETAKELNQQVTEVQGARQKRLIKRLKLIKALIRNKIRPEWMVMTVLPVIPPDLRPMVQLDGGRFAASDLNDLYRRVINRNNRLKRLLELNAPEVITRNERRMLQEAVDALIDNSARHGKTVTASTGQKRMLKSLADILKGKQGRFRQNLLGKRVDYSGRSVIVVGSHLKLHQCGLPKRMALELFRPFVISKLIQREYVHNIRSANRFIESGRSEVWDILEEVTRGTYVLLNRAPTLHRLGIQSFQPILIEGKAIQIHPMVCPAFNADFDGDQMAVHVPLTEQAKEEAEKIMLSSKNLLKPATGEPVVTPSQDLVLGAYYMTFVDETRGKEEINKHFSSPEEAIMAYELGKIKLQEKIWVKIAKQRLLTTVGRVIFNLNLPKKLRFVNQILDRPALRDLISRALESEGEELTVKLLDQLKDMSLIYLTQSGLSWGMDDVPSLPGKKELLQEADRQVEEIRRQFEEGLLTDQERHIKVVEVWAAVRDKVTQLSKTSLPKDGSVYAMIASGARGSWGQTTQMMGMKGIVTNPAGETIELPVKASFKEGFSVLEYFISTHGARKGLSDTALRTANAGYLTRRLIDVAQDVVVREADCGDNEGLTISKEEAEESGQKLIDKLKGRVLTQDIPAGPRSKKIVAKKGQLVDEVLARQIEKANPNSVAIRSVLTCRSRLGLCAKCYGWDLGYNRLVKPGTAVGIIAAQSIGEPGTQLTMRTFHTGGVAGLDITQGLPRVEEIFEARPVKRPALIAPLAGQVSVKESPADSRQKILVIRGQEQLKQKLPITSEDLDKLLVKEGKKVKKGQQLVEDRAEIVAPATGELIVEELSDSKVSLVIKSEREVEKELKVPSGYSLWVKDGELVEKGQQLTEGPLDLHDLYSLRGQVATQKYIIKEIQYIYSSQGQKLNDKHIEVIARQMFSRVYIQDPGESDFLSGEVVEKPEYEAVLAELKKKKKRLPFGRSLMLGITKASLSTSSFLSAASFQETARVLIDAAVFGKIDYLRGLKENVIIGRLIPVGTGYDYHKQFHRVSK